MTVAASIEIVPGGPPSAGGVASAGSGRSLGAGKALIAGNSGASNPAFASLTSSTGASPASFRAGLQPLLDALNLDALNTDLGSGTDTGAAAVLRSGLSANSPSGTNAAVKRPIAPATDTNYSPTAKAPSTKTPDLTPASLPVALQKTASVALWTTTAQPEGTREAGRKSSSDQPPGATAASREKKPAAAPPALSVNGVSLGVSAPPLQNLPATELAAPVVARNPVSSTVPALPRNLPSNLGVQENQGNGQSGVEKPSGKTTDAAASVSRNSSEPRISPLQISPPVHSGADSTVEPETKPVGASSSWNLRAAGAVSTAGEPLPASGLRASASPNPQPSATNLFARPEAENISAVSPTPPDSSRVSAATLAPATMRQEKPIESVGQSEPRSVPPVSISTGTQLTALPVAAATPAVLASQINPSPAAQNLQVSSPNVATQVQLQKADTPIVSSHLFNSVSISDPVKAVSQSGVDSTQPLHETGVLATATENIRQTTGSLQANATAAVTIAPGKIEELTPGSLPDAAISGIQPPVSIEPVAVSTAPVKSVIPPMRGDKQSASAGTATAVSNRAPSSSGVQTVAPSPAKNNIAQPQVTPDDRPVHEAAAHSDAQAGNSAGTVSPHAVQQSAAQGIVHPPPSSNAQPAIDSAGTRGVVNPVGPVLNNTGAVAIPSAESRETFAALDAEPASAPATWVHAGSNQAEAGFNDPNLGWVSVRADQSGGAIHATLVPGSSEAASALSSHLDGLNAYLDSRHSPVQSLTVAEPEGRSSSWGGDSGMNQGMRQGMSDGTQQGTGQDTGSGYGQRSDSDSGFQIGPAADARSTSTEVSSQAGVSPVSSPTADFSNGVHISVIA